MWYMTMTMTIIHVSSFWTSVIYLVSGMQIIQAKMLQCFRRNVHYIIFYNSKKETSTKFIILACNFLINLAAKSIYNLTKHHEN